MKTVNVHEAKTTLSQLLAEVEQGHEVLIARNGHPVARLSSVAPAIRRDPGLWQTLPGWDTYTVDATVFAPMTDEAMAEEGWP